MVWHEKGDLHWHIVALGKVLYCLNSQARKGIMGWAKNLSAALNNYRNGARGARIFIHHGCKSRVFSFGNHVARRGTGPRPTMLFSRIMSFIL